jgi:hypothetical protein
MATGRMGRRQEEAPPCTWTAYGVAFGAPVQEVPVRRRPARYESADGARPSHGSRGPVCRFRQVDWRGVVASLGRVPGVVLTLRLLEGE